MNETVTSVEIYVPKQPDRAEASRNRVVDRLGASWYDLWTKLVKEGGWEGLPGKRVRITAMVVRGERR